MKKILLIAAVAGFVMTSCKKDYTCECTTTTTAPGIPPQTATTSTTINDKEDEAKSTCEANNQTVESGGITSTVKCEIK